MNIKSKLTEALTNNVTNISRFDHVIAIAEKHSDIHPSETIWTEEQMNLSIRSTKALQPNSITLNTEF
jgi:hypothetical protein